MIPFRILQGDGIVPCDIQESNEDNRRGGGEYRKLYDSCRHLGGVLCEVPYWEQLVRIPLNSCIVKSVALSAANYANLRTNSRH